MSPAAAPAGAVGVGGDPVPGSPGTTVPVRPLSFREQLDEPFALIQANVVALAVLTGAGIALAETLVFGVTALCSELSGGSDAGIAWGAVLGSALAILLLRFLIRGCTVALGLATLSGDRPGPVAALAALRPRLGGLLRFQLWFTGVGVLVGGVVVPLTGGAGVLWLAYLRARYYLVIPLLLGERLPYGAAVARSRLLADRASWSLAWLWICRMLLLTVLAVPLFAIPLYLSDYTGTRRWAVILLITGGVLVIAAIGELIDAAGRVVCYVDRRCRREGLDIVVTGGAR
ncbi:hypothetical protein [Nocardia jiangsuensis]|uniref:Glycerophosphoryl diester phosphodiesterase family protein n=1 Tax=Nocardia jiangsuensis TaxID=1691563 RepID=A0ABV8DUK9_9NOCA